MDLQGASSERVRAYNDGSFKGYFVALLYPCISSSDNSMSNTLGNFDYATVNSKWSCEYIDYNGTCFISENGITIHKGTRYATKGYKFFTCNFEHGTYFHYSRGYLPDFFPARMGYLSHMRICLGTDSCNIQICQEELDISERVGNFVRY